MKTSHFSQVLLVGLALMPSTVQAVEQEKGVILKITDSGKGGNVVAKPFGSDPKRIVEELNAQGITEVRVQINNGEPMSAVTAKGAEATNTLAKLGFKGKVILDNKQWHLNKLESQNDWVSAMRQTYEKMDANGKSIVGGFSFGETTADDESWAAYSKGVAEAVQKLDRSFQLSADKKFLTGKKFYVGGASFGGSFRQLKPEEHAVIKKSIEGVGGTLIYAYKSFHSRKGLPQSKDEDLASKANAKKFLLDIAGLANLAQVAGHTPVQYRGNGFDGISNEANLIAALIEIFNEHPNFLHVGAEVIINSHSEATKGHLFDESGKPHVKEWAKLNNFANEIRKNRVGSGK